MSSTMYGQESPSPVVTRRPPLTKEASGTNSQRSANRRSLSGRLRDLFRKDSSSPARSSSTERRPVTNPTRQSSSSPNAPGLRAPTVYWPFGKKKNKPSGTSNTPTPNKNRKDNRKPEPSPVVPREPSSPRYDQENRTPNYGQTYVPRTPDPVHIDYGGSQIPSNYDPNATRIVINYRMADPAQPYQQVVVPDANEFTPLTTYTSNYSPSTSDYRPYTQNPTIEYYYPTENPMPSITMPLADVEVIHTPQPKRKVADTPPITNTPRVVERPPTFTEPSSGPFSTSYPSNINSYPTQPRGLPPSSYQPAEMRSTTSLYRDSDVPKLNTPVVNFGSTSSKKKPKRTKSQSRADEVHASTPVLSSLVTTNPVKPSRLTTSTYGSLPDAEIISSNELNSFKAPKPNPNRYPGLSAIVYHHLNPSTIYYNERPPRKPTPTPTTVTTTPQQPRRYDTSTATINDYDRNEPWSTYIPKETSTSTSNLQRYDGYIRPMSPESPSVTVDVNVYHLGPDDLNRTASPPTVRVSCYESPEHTGTYRSSKTIYTRDRARVGSGEIRTWSSQDLDTIDSRNDVCKCPYSFAHADRANDYNRDIYEHQVVLPAKKDNFEEYRYSPRAHEQDCYVKPQRTNDETDREMQEERYEVSYVYDDQNQYTYERKHYCDESQPANRYPNESGVINNFVSANPLSTIQPSNNIERADTYQQPARSYTPYEYTQESLVQGTPVRDSQPIIFTCALKRTDSYDGLGILISTDTQTHSNHYIREVEPNSPGQKAGLRKNDQIICINGHHVENVDFNDVLVHIKQGLNNDNLKLSVIRERDYI